MNFEEIVQKFFTALILEFGVGSEAVLLLRCVVTSVGYDGRFVAISAALNYKRKFKCIRPRRIISWKFKKNKKTCDFGRDLQQKSTIDLCNPCQTSIPPPAKSRRRCWVVLVIFNINPLAKFSYSCLISLGLGLGVVTSDSTRTSPVIHIDDEPRPHQLQQHSYAIWETRVLGWGLPKFH